MVTGAIYKAREQFLTDGHIGHDLETAVSPDVLRSWRRSRLSGARSEAPGLPLILESTSESALTVAAEPVLARLAEQFAGLRAGVLLSDRHAKILRRWAPDLQSLAHMDQTCSAVGASGAEAEVGTNGIGTVTEERRAQMIVGPEHFAEIFNAHACIGAPIHHPLLRTFEGVVTLSAGVDVASPLLLPLVMSTARQIEQRLLEQASRKERTLLDAFLAASRRGAAAAVIGEGVFMVGPKASRLLQGIDPSALWLRLRDEVSGLRRTSIVLGAPENPVRLTCSPLMLDDHLVGAVLHVVQDADAPVGAIHHGVREMSHYPGVRGPQRPVRAGWPEGRRSLPGRSAIWTAVLGAAAAQADQMTPLIVFGEPGTGKVSVLRAVHAASSHAEDAFRVVDCAGAVRSPASLLGTGESSQRAGTLVLRHIDGLDDAGAAALGAALQDRAERPGLRIVATSTSPGSHGSSVQHRRLLDEMAVGRIEVPALRQRSEDIPDLVTQMAEVHGATPLRFDPKATVALQRSPWPGNLRQLEAVIRGLLAVDHGREITVEMLPPEVGAHSRRRPLTPMEQLELDAILTTLRQTGGNKVLAAQTLGISRSTLYRKMTSYQLNPDINFF